jgi:hypothetical protein
MPTKFVGKPEVMRIFGRLIKSRADNIKKIFKILYEGALCN